MKGPRMIIATTSDHTTDEDTDIGSRVTRSIIDNFLRRPSLEDYALTTIATMASNDLAMLHASDEVPLLCDAAFVLMDRNRARFLISGGSVAYHFENGVLAHQSEPAESSIIGSGPRYQPHLDPVFQLNNEKNAFLTASRALAEKLTRENLEETLNASETPEDWMRKLEALAGDDRQFCAVTVFLPQSSPSFFKSLFNRVR